MEAIVTTAIGGSGPVKSFVIGKGAIGAGLFSGLSSFATMEAMTGNTVLAIAISAVLSSASAAVVAYYHHRPRYIEAISHARLTESELLGRRTSALLTRLEQQNANNIEIIRLHVECRHDVQNALQGYFSHGQYLERLLTEHKITFPALNEYDIGKRLATLDKEIKAVGRPEEAPKEQTI